MAFVNNLLYHVTSADHVVFSNCNYRGIRKEKVYIGTHVFRAVK